MTSFPHYTDGKFDIHVRFEAAGNMVAVFSGEMSARDPARVLGPMFADLLERLEKRRLVLDFRSVTFMNSSSLAPVIALIKEINLRETGATLVYDTGRSWQKVSMQCMSVLCQKMKGITVTKDAA